MKNNKKSTVKAAKAQIERDTENSTKPTPQSTQGSLADRHVRAHTPDSLYGDESATTAE
ncbi:hypothetical protein [Streptomyces sp. NPDC006355]|uniref:hypothetical protein n=1 Tax=Streptomyces sp. NPDC006355 TaxID=3156758 RepID=UPI0033AAB4D3